MKLLLLSFAFLLAMSLDQVAQHYIAEYFTTSTLSAQREVLLRLAYPALILFTLWTLKAIMLD